MNNKKVLCFLTLGAVLMSSSVFAQDKVALVIGNSKYKDLPLKNPVNDAKDMKAMLEKAGFTVIYADDADIDEMDEATDKFIDSLDRDSLSLFYYSGHGLQVNGVNYLLPINANIKTDNADQLATSLKRGAYSTNDLLLRLEGVKNPTNIVILDACRNNPLEKPSEAKGLYVSKGLGIEEASDSFLVAYATAPGRVATDDQKSKNSLYTKYLKQYLFEPGLTIESALKKVSKSVKKENPSQVPWYNNSIDEELCLAGCETSPVVSAPKTTYAPLLSFVSGANSVTQNKSYAVKFTGTDSDGDLSKILIDWGDGTAITSKTAKNGTAVSFSHTYKFAGMFDLIATAIDKQNAESETYSKEVQVNEMVVSAPPVTPPILVNVPNISNANASPSSIIKGNSITFSANLSLALPSGYVVKVNYGNGFMNMNGSGTNFTLTAIPASSAAYRVGVYDSAGVLKSNELTGNFEVTQPAPVNVAPTLSFISGNDSATTNTAYSVQLQAADSDNNLSSIAINWGDGASDSKAATNSNTLTFSHIYTSEKTYNWSATAADSGSLKSNAVSKNVVVSKPVVVAPPIETKPTTSTTKGDVETFVSGDKIFSYTKIANDGSELPKTAKLGTAPKDWACTKDNKTGLIWEVKTSDGGLRDSPKAAYTWDDSFIFRTAVNTQGLCGAKDWRIPTVQELGGLLVCSDGKYKTYDGGQYIGYDSPTDTKNMIDCINFSDTIPTMNTTYFPDIIDENSFFWSSSVYDYGVSAWVVGYGSSGYEGSIVGSRANVRLVRNLSSSSDAVHRIASVADGRTFTGTPSIKDVFIIDYEAQREPLAAFAKFDAVTITGFVKGEDILQFNNTNASVTVDTVTGAGFIPMSVTKFTDSTTPALSFVTIDFNEDPGQPDARITLIGVAKIAATATNPTKVDAGNIVFSNEVSKPVVIAPSVVSSGTSSSSSSYTKIANNGSVLSDDAKLGSNPTDWACTKDNKTGLIWEVKTDDGGLRDKDWYYSWYKPDGDNGGNAGYQNGNGHPEWCKGSDCDTYAFTNAVNAQGLCGASDWRLPTNEELRALVVCSDGRYNTLGKDEAGYICTGSPTAPIININYFPNTQSSWFWSSSPNAYYGSNYAWFVVFSSGYSGSYFSKSIGYYVRLARG